MDRGLYIAASGMIADQIRQDQLANDLANTSTIGYKADRSAQRSFGSMLIAERGTGQVLGTATLGTEIAEIRTNFAPAPIRETHEPLDIALDGEGFLAVRTPAGVRYTRDGELRRAEDGTLVTATGNQVLGTDGNTIKIASEADAVIGGDGAVTSGGATVGKIAVVTLTNPAKEGVTLFTGTAGPAPTSFSLRQGFLETSGVDSAQIMVEMMASMRAYESAQRVIHAIDDTLGKGIQAAQIGS